MIWSGKQVVKVYYGNVEIGEVWAGPKLVWRNNRAYTGVFALVILDGRVVLTKADCVLTIISGMIDNNIEIKEVGLSEAILVVMGGKLGFGGSILPISVMYQLPGILGKLLLEGNAEAKVAHSSNTEATGLIEVNDIVNVLLSETIINSIANKLLLDSQVNLLLASCISMVLKDNIRCPVCTLLAVPADVLNNTLESILKLQVAMVVSTPQTIEVAVNFNIELTALISFWDTYQEGSILFIGQVYDAVQVDDVLEVI